MNRIFYQIQLFTKYLRVEVPAFFVRNKYGVMGTLAFHMLILIVLLSLKLNTKRVFIEPEIFIDIPQEVLEQIEQEKEEKIEEKLQEKKMENKESIDELLKSIAVNREVEKKQSQPIQSVEEMIKNIKSNMSDYVSDDVSNGEENLDQFVKDSLQALSDQEKQRMLDSLQSIEYSGPSSVYYSLKGRHKIYLPIPVFTCEGDGRIVVQIKVNQQGRVVGVKIVEKESVADDCLQEAALRASRRTRFNVSTKSPKEQKGSITYHFVKQ